MPNKLVIFGKGGIGKSTTTANLAVVYAQMGLKVLVVGCDPKHDTTMYLTGGKQIPTILENAAFLSSTPLAQSLLVKGTLGIDCVEAGGPEPGIGCAGRGITRMSEILKEAGVVEDSQYDVILYDVLGDVVCGGFAAPLRQGFADKVAIVTSEELMSLYAANNIAKAVKNYASNGISLVGLIANLRDPGCDHEAVSRFASIIGTQVIQFLPRDPAVREAEYQKKTIVETNPDGELVARLRVLAQRLLDIPAVPACIPNPMTDVEFNEISRLSFRVETRPGAAPLRGPSNVAAPLAHGVAAASGRQRPEAWRQFLRDAAQHSALDTQTLAFENELSLHVADPEFLRKKRKKGTISWIGAPEGRDAKEWIQLLREAGIVVHKDARDLMAGEVQVFFPRPAYQKIYASLLMELPIQPLPLAVPCGIELSQRWLSQVAGKLGRRKAAEKAWDALWRKNRPAWEKALEQAAGLRVAVVGDVAQLRVLARDGAGGLPLFAALREMGFGLDLLVYTAGGARPKMGQDERTRVTWFSTPEELGTRISSGDFFAVYSEFPADDRVSKGGKVAFGPELFELGPLGAIRNANRLLALHPLTRALA